MVKLNDHRPMVSAMNDILHESQPVLDHGFIRVVDYMGNDAAVVQAARTSYGTGTKSKSEDKGLIHYLMRHHHTTPFEMCEIKLHVKLPIFVARQWIRHRTASVNEVSARYSVLNREFYVPAPEHLASQSTSNKQGRGAVLEGQEAEDAIATIRDHSEISYEHYMNLLEEEPQGLARELARAILPVNFYTEWYWKVDLHNLMNFLRLRADPHAQYEIRAYADVLLEILKLWVPHTYEAFMEHRMGSVNLSATAWKFVRELVDGLDHDQPNSGLSKREYDDLMEALNG